MSVTLAFSERLWDELRAALEHSEESAGILAARPVLGDRVTLLARSIRWTPVDLYSRRDGTGLEIPSLGYVPGLKAAAADSSVAIFFHTHPRGKPNPSRFDTAVDSQLELPFRLRTRQPLYGSFILGGTSGTPTFSGQVYWDDHHEPLERVRVVGRRLQLALLSANRVDEDTFDRQIRAFGRSGQRLLSQIHAGVVGAGGTGSAVFEQLVRLGVGEITVCDDDVVSSTNLTRIHESGQTDIGRPKVELADLAARRIGLGTRVHPIANRITDLRAIRQLRHCDVIFGCTDDNRGRAILSRFAYWYLVPIFDTAFLVDTVDGRARGLFGRVTPIRPGVACLLCRGRIDSAELAAEGLPDAERQRLAGEGYVPGLGEPDPSVGTYTTLVAALAVTEFLDQLFHFSDDEPAELLLRLHEHALSRIGATSRPDHYCADPAIWGSGDVEPFLDQMWS